MFDFSQETAEQREARLAQQRQRDRTLENIQNHFCKVKHFVFGYLEALQQRKELDEAQK